LDSFYISAKKLNTIFGDTIINLELAYFPKPLEAKRKMDCAHNKANCEFQELKRLEMESIQNEKKLDCAFTKKEKHLIELETEFEKTEREYIGSLFYRGQFFPSYLFEARQIFPWSIGCNIHSLLFYIAYTYVRWPEKVVFDTFFYLKHKRTTYGFWKKRTGKYLPQPSDFFFGFTDIVSKSKLLQSFFEKSKNTLDQLDKLYETDDTQCGELPKCLLNGSKCSLYGGCLREMNAIFVTLALSELFSDTPKVQYFYNSAKKQYLLVIHTKFEFIMYRDRNKICQNCFTFLVSSSHNIIFEPNNTSFIEYLVNKGTLKEFVPILEIQRPKIKETSFTEKKPANTSPPTIEPVTKQKSLVIAKKTPESPHSQELSNPQKPKFTPKKPHRDRKAYRMAAKDDEESSIIKSTNNENNEEKPILQIELSSIPDEF
jgi:hypothetical protein